MPVLLLGSVIHIYNPSSWESQARELAQMWDQSEIQSKTLSQKVAKGRAENKPMKSLCSKASVYTWCFRHGLPSQGTHFISLRSLALEQERPSFMVC